MSAPAAKKETTLPGGLDRIWEIAEKLRERNKDGYLQGYGGILANIKSHGSLSIPPTNTATTCSPFTGTVVGIAFDPDYPREDIGDHPDPYRPKYNGGDDELQPFNVFYTDFNGNNAQISTLIKYKLAYEITDLNEIRRGDILEIGWTTGSGHAAICWDVHLEGDEVDAFQILGSHGGDGYYDGGVSIYGCLGPPWTNKGHSATPRFKEVERPKTDPKTKKQIVDPATQKPVMEKVKVYDGLDHGTYEKAKSKIFVYEDDEIVKKGVWHEIPNRTNRKKIRTETFKVVPDRILPANKAGKGIVSASTLRAARFYYDGHDKPRAKPYCMKDGAAAAEPSKPGHADAPATVVKGPDLKKDATAPKKVPTKPAKQDTKKPVNWQPYVESALRQFHDAKWIESDPGKSENINDAASQAALKELQGMFDIDVDGIIGPDTLTVIGAQLPACATQATSQLVLGMLHSGKKLEHDPGPPGGVNTPEMKAAIEEFQDANGLKKTGVPDAATQKKLFEVRESFAPTTEKAGLSPEIKHLYWVKSPIDVGATARLRLHSRHLKIGQECPIRLTDLATGKTIDSDVKLVVQDEESEAVVPIPAANFPPGSSVMATVTAQLDDEGELEATTTPALAVARGTLDADWRPYIGKDEVPADVLDAVRKNRAMYPKPKDLVPTQGDVGYDFHGPAAHQKWEHEWVQKKIDDAKAKGDFASLHVLQAFKKLLTGEGSSASLYTVDSQIVTWGVGLGGLGDGKGAFTKLERDAKMKKLLDGIGITYDAKAVAYHVVHLDKKKVISSSPPVKGDKQGLGRDSRHIPPLDAWRQQVDLLSAIVGISVDPTTREAVMQSQFDVYIENSAQWSGQDKVFSMALFYTITHLYHWVKAIAKGGMDVNKQFAAIGGGTPSFDTDKKIALPLLQGFAAYVPTYAEWRLRVMGDKIDVKDIQTRTKTHVWRDYRAAAKAEGYDPGEFTYE